MSNYTHHFLSAQGITVKDTYSAELMVVEPFKYSEWLVEKYRKLVDKKFKRNRLCNRLVTWPITILAGLGTIVGLFIAALPIIHISPDMLGITIGLSGILVGQLVFCKLDDLFPVNPIYPWYKY